LRPQLDLRMSKAFRFPLQKVLNYRKSVEDRCIIALKRSQSILLQAEDKLHSMQHAKDSFLNTQSNNNQPISLTELQISTDYLDQMNGMIDRQVLEVTRSEKIVDKDRETLLGATKEHKIAEKLSERQKHEYLLESRKKELLNQSEIALQVSAKNKGSAK